MNKKQADRILIATLAYGLAMANERTMRDFISSIEKPSDDQQARLVSRTLVKKDTLAALQQCINDATDKTSTEVA